ncbi:rRNA maturation RNase YbeY [Bacillus haikouensis]|uniref:rRNA maturation RNase YbeY n=1 Tax=Bacillus haikouensis TaxID=1510468 RepID=UPI00155642A1|nr:rRNA maturation RNase YbeY [Bacillus haikouensis]NQD66850.1 rRNA maturation RNase YbeY [Bacillus haikouensis]
MTLSIDFIDETDQLTEEQIEQIQGILNVAADKEGVEEGSEVSITFLSNERIREINRDYRHKDQPTDVISFALEELGEDEIEIVGTDMPRILGDIIISVERAKEQAEEYNHSFSRELGFLALHGFLHLLGYDHIEEEDEKEMFQTQKDILEEYGLTRD